jgi:hypothetical protein
MDKANALGDYLRARRDLIRPEDIGLIPGSRRKVPGLRREELAMLAGISPGTDGLQMVIYHAEPGTESGQALALLGSIAATAERDAAERDTAIRAVAEQAAPPAGTYHPEKESS